MAPALKVRVTPRPGLGVGPQALPVLYPPSEHLQRSVDSTLRPSPPLILTGNDFLRSLPPSALPALLTTLDAVIWRATVDPFQLTGWSAESTDAQAGPPSALHSLSLTAATDWEALIYPPDRPCFRHAVRAYLEGQTDTPRIDYRLIVNDGELIWVRQWLLALEASSDDGTQVVGLVRDVTDEKRLQAELTQACNIEQARLGQEIHDDIGQIFTGLNLLVHTLQQRLKSERPDVATELESINCEILAGLERTRALAHGLLPAQSDFNNLQQAFRDLSKQVATRLKLQLTYEVPSPEPPYSRECLLHLYRIVQEASSNAFKHGRANRVDVHLDQRDGWDVLSIQDNGCGLPAEAARNQGVGLNGMRNRAALLGGRLEVGNGPQGGALVQVYLPPSAVL